MAKSWARIRNEYGDTAYMAKDFTAEHRIKMNSKSEYGAFNQLITNVGTDLDKTIPIISIKEKYKGMSWKWLRDNTLPDTVEDIILSPQKNKKEYTPLVNKRIGRKVILTKGSIDHLKQSI